MIEKRIDEAMVILLDHSEAAVVTAVAGVLMNFSADPDHMQLFTQFGAMGVLLLGSTWVPGLQILHCCFLVIQHTPAWRVLGAMRHPCSTQYQPQVQVWQASVVQQQWFVLLQMLWGKGSI